MANVILVICVVISILRVLIGMAERSILTRPDFGKENVGAIARAKFREERKVFTFALVCACVIIALSLLDLDLASQAPYIAGLCIVFTSTLHELYAWRLFIKTEQKKSADANRSPFFSLKERLFLVCRTSAPHAHGSGATTRT